MVQEVREAAGTIRFHPFVLDLSTRELRRQGKPIKLQPQPLRVLAFLASRPNKVITRAEIQKHLWSDGTFVDFDQGINFCIKQIRAALGDDAGEPRYVQTLPRRGYRFIAPLRPEDETPKSVCGSGYGVSGGSRYRIAVLPFACISSEGKFDYVADGLTEELIVTLAGIKELRLIARTSVMQYKGTPKPIAEIGRELSVGTILEGSVRTNGTTLRINAELIDTGTQETLWSDEYDRDIRDLFRVQSDVAQKIAEALKSELITKSEAPIVGWSVGKEESYELVSRGRFFMEKRTELALHKALGCFEQAIQKDANIAVAYAGIAESYVLMSLFNYLDPSYALPQARRAAIRAVELEDTLADGHVSLALVRMCLDWDLTEAERELNRAVEIDPSNVWAHLWFSVCLGAMRRLDEEVASIERARGLAPLSITVNSRYGAVLRDQGRYDRAIEQLQETIEMEPEYPPAHAVLAGVYAETGMYEEWAREYEKALTLSGAEGLARVVMPAYREGGYRPAMRRAADELAAHSSARYVSCTEIAGLYAEAGKEEEALHWLERAYERRDPHLIFIDSRGISPSLPWKTGWYALKADARFAALRDKMKLGVCEPSGAPA